MSTARLNPDEVKISRKVFRLVQSVDRRWRPSDVCFRAGQVLIAACFVGADVHKLARLTHSSEAFVERVAARCRKGRIWRNGAVRCAWNKSDIAFVADALVAAGFATRPADPKVSATYKARREKRASAGRCVNCGRAVTSGANCDDCKASMKASKARRREKSTELNTLKLMEPWYRYASDTGDQGKE